MDVAAGAAAFAGASTMPPAGSKPTHSNVTFDMITGTLGSSPAPFGVGAIHFTSSSRSTTHPKLVFVPAPDPCHPESWPGQHRPAGRAANQPIPATSGTASSSY
jgi:hypothetical protein